MFDFIIIMNIQEVRVRHEKIQRTKRWIPCAAEHFHRENEITHQEFIGKNGMMKVAQAVMR